MLEIAELALRATFVIIFKVHEIPRCEIISKNHVNQALLPAETAPCPRDAPQTLALPTRLTC